MLLAVSTDDNLELVSVLGVLRHMQRYFSYIRDGTDVQAE